MGKDDEGRKIITMYRGQEGIDSFRKVLDMKYPDFGDGMLQRKYMEVAYVSKEEVPENEYVRLEAYERDTSIYFQNKGWPVIYKSDPYKIGDTISKPDEEADIVIMLQYTWEMSDQLKSVSKEQLGFVTFDPEAGDMEIPKIEINNGIYQISLTKVPKPVKKIFKPVMAENEVLLKKLGKIRKTGSLLCQLGGVMSQDSLRDDGRFSIMIFAVPENSGTPLCEEKAYDYEEHPEHLLDRFLQCLSDNNYVPEKFVARDERTAAFLKDVAQKTGCGLEIRQDLPGLDQQIESYMLHHDVIDYITDEDFSEEDLQDMVREMISMPNEFFRDLPGEEKETVKILLDAGVLPPDLQKELKTRLEHADQSRSKSGKNKKRKRAGKKHKSTRSYVISVSPYTGCYRHIRVATDISLSELAAVILDAFDFWDDGHLYSFFMDNKAWSDVAEYEKEPDKDSFWGHGRKAANYTLEKALLRDDGKFLFLFDYGDEWRFSCRVLREIPESTEGYLVVRSKGDAPEQYQ